MGNHYLKLFLVWVSSSGGTFLKYSIFSLCCHFVQHSGTHVVLVEGISGI